MNPQMFVFVTKAYLRTLNHLGGSYFSRLRNSLFFFGWRSCIKYNSNVVKETKKFCWLWSLANVILRVDCGVIGLVNSVKYKFSC